MASVKKVKAKAKRANPNNNNREALQMKLADVDARIEGAEEYIRTEKARKLVPLIKKTSWHKGEVYDLTPRQFRTLLGYEPRKAVIRKGKVPWEYCLDQLATELKYPSDEALKKAIEDVGKQMHKIDELKATRRELEEEIMALPKEKIPRKVAMKFTKKRIAINGKVTAYEVVVGKDIVGHIVAFPPSYGVYPSANGLSLKVAPIGGAKSIKKAKELAKKGLR